MSSRTPHAHIVPPRSEGIRQSLREVQPWPKGKTFKILSIDGGGIRGLLPCLVLAEMEKRFLGGQPIGEHFDMIVGTSTGGIIALGLGQGKSARHMSELYRKHGRHIFTGNRFLRRLQRCFLRSYNLKNLENVLRHEFKDNRLESSKVAMCIPSFEGRYGEVYIFKTPHHPDYKKDKHEKLVDIGLSTAAAPTYFSAMERNGYIFADGGIWANNPAMIGVVEAITCFDIDRTQIRLLSLGCGQSKYKMQWWHRIGGRLFWADHFFKAAMRIQSYNAINQAGLLIGRSNMIRIDKPEVAKNIDMDDVDRAMAEIPSLASSLSNKYGDRVNEMFLTIQGRSRVNGHG